MARQAWMEARAKADFKLFQAHLEKILELNQRYVSFFPPKDHPYDLLLDNFEPGIKTADVKGIFDELRPLQIELIKAVGKHPQVDDAFLHLGYDEKKQWDFSVEVIRAVGYDLNRGRLDKSAHPFSTSFSMDDVRITTRFERDSGVSALFSSLHEAGHALYEQGFDPVWKRTPIADGSSLAMHESQSRLWENIIGRSRPFWEYYFPKLKALFPAQLNNVTLDQFYRGINKVQPSLIRVEADEATYNLHIMLRFELEIAMIEGKLPIKELPSAWNDKMQAYLGIVPPDDALGVLQDIHWSLGSLGYFPTYALGNLISAQLWEKYQSINSDISDQIRKGDFSALLAWLRDAIHQYGRKYEPKELVTRITRSNIDPTPYMRYLTAKFGEIYEL
jgi:carboxypeptidase Taq